MELLDVLLDLFFFLSGIACAVTIIRKRKSFDLWVSFPACAAWIFKGMRLLCFDWFIHSMKNMKDERIFSFYHNALRVLQGLDTLIFFLLLAALLRLINHWVFIYRYNKTLKQLHKS